MLDIEQIKLYQKDIKDDCKITSVEFKYNLKLEV